MQVTAIIQGTDRVQRGYFTLEQMSLLKPIHHTIIQKSAKANSMHALTPKAPEKPPETAAAQEKPQVATSAKPRATKRQRKTA